jgi:hypothetical protein
MKDSLRDGKPTLETLLSEKKLIRGKDLLKRYEDVEKQKILLQEAIEFESRNRKSRSR